MVVIRRLMTEDFAVRVFAAASRLWINIAVSVFKGCPACEFYLFPA